MACSTGANDVGLLKSNSLPQNCATQSDLNKILTDFFVILGAVAVLMMVIAAIRYIAARGNAEKTAQAKNMIMYSLMGLVIAMLAAAIVNVVLSKSGG